MPPRIHLIAKATPHLILRHGANVHGNTHARVHAFTRLPHAASTASERNRVWFCLVCVRMCDCAVVLACEGAVALALFPCVSALARLASHRAETC